MPATTRRRIAFKCGIDWDAVRAEIDAQDWEPDDSFCALPGAEIRRVYLGSVLYLTPSGKLYMPWSSNVTDREASRDERWWERLDWEATRYGLCVDTGEGDLCDIFAVESRDNPESDD